MDCSDKNVLYYGKSEPLPPKQILKAGSLSMVLESGCLRYVSCSGTELIRNIYSAVRDRNWGTIIPVISNEVISQNSDGFVVSYTARYSNSEIDFIARYQISGDGNTLSFSMDGEALSSFSKNRIGFCVLHPLEGVKGVPCRVIHPGGSETCLVFPESVSPHSPVSNIESMEWENSTAACKLSFEGDVWEMEDHRNWTDTSYKTYCTPLSIPFPAPIEAGCKIKQKVTLTVTPKPVTGEQRDKKVLRVKELLVDLPQIGTAIGQSPVSSADCKIIQQAVNYLRHDVKFGHENWAELFHQAIKTASEAQVPLELVLHFSKLARLDAQMLQKFVQRHQVSVRYIWMIREYSRLTDSELIREVGETIRTTFPGAKIGGGTDAYFAEFNRNRFVAEGLDFVTFAICPQVHAFDNDSLAENIAAQADVVKSAQLIYPGAGVHISPVTLRQRFNVVATGDEPPTPPDQLPSQVDVRQMSLFAAGWTMASIAVLAAAGASAVTYYEATGWRGLIQGDNDPSRPGLFAGRRGDIFPVYHVLRFFQKHKFRMRGCESSHPLNFSGLLLQADQGKYMVVANHGMDQAEVEIQGVEMKRVLMLSAGNMAEAVHNENFTSLRNWTGVSGNLLTLLPYAVVFIEVE